MYFNFLNVVLQKDSISLLTITLNLGLILMLTEHVVLIRENLSLVIVFLRVRSHFLENKETKHCYMLSQKLSIRAYFNCL